MTKTLTPEPGHYTVKLERGAVAVAVEIYYTVPDRCPETGDMMEDQNLEMNLNGRIITDYNKIDGYWSWLVPVGQSKHDYRKDLAAWERAHYRQGAFANPRQAVDFATMKAPFLGD